MKKLLKWIYLVAAVMMLSSCGMFDGRASLDYLPAKEDSDDKWGMVGPDGKMLFSDEFENEPTAVINGYFAVEEDEGYSVYKADKRPELVKGLEELTSVGAMSEGVMPICRKGKRIEYVNGKGETQFVLKPIGGKEVVAVWPAFCEGLAPFILEDGKLGAIDRDGNVVIKPIFSYMGPFLGDYTLAGKGSGSDTKYMIINQSGNVVAKLKSGMMPLSFTVIDDLLPVVYHDQCGFFTIKGEFKKCPSKVEGIGVYNKDFYVYKNDEGKSGVMSTTENKIVVRAKYKDIFIRDGKFICLRDDEIEILDTNGEKVASIADVSDGYDVIAMAKYSGFSTDFDFAAGDKYGAFYNVKGEQIGKTEFEKISKMIYMSDAVRSDYASVAQEEAEEVAPEAEEEAGYDYSDQVCNTLLEDSDVAYLDKATLRLMRNTIFARHGRKFQSEDLQEYFSKFSWYYPVREEVSVNELTDIETHNLNLIQRYE